MMDPISKYIMDNLIEKTASILMPVMLAAFVIGVFLRFVVFYTARSELKFCLEFEKRVRKRLIDPAAKKVDSFFMLAKSLLEQTYYETFEMRARFRRRNLDHVATVSDRLFLIQDAAAYLVRDTLRQIRYLKRDGYPPRMVEVSKSAFESNPVFNKVMGIFPAGMLNDLLNILPGLFIIGGIFGTFLGIAKGLPELGAMDLSNIDETKKVMDFFLVKISQAMVKSIVGIALSVIMSLVNTLLSAEGVHYNLVNKFTSSLELLWNETSTNTIEESEPQAGSPAQPADGGHAKEAEKAA